MSDKVLVCGSVAFDTITVFEGHFKDHILADHIKSLSVSFFVPSMRKEYGGCAGNIAYSLRLLGGNPLPVATVGSDAADYLDYMKAQGIDTRWVRVLDDMYTPQCFITTDKDNNQIASFHPGAMLRSSENAFLRDEGVAWGIVAPDAKEGMFAHARRMREQGIPFVFDLGQAMPLFNGEDLTEMLSLAHIVTANDYEAGIISERTGRSMQDIARSLQAVIVTRGAQGTTLYEGGQTVDIGPVPAKQVVDPTGCGDAHRAGVLYGLTHDWSLVDSCRLANVMGSFKIGSRGPQNHKPSLAEVDAALQENYGIRFA